MRLAPVPAGILAGLAHGAALLDVPGVEGGPALVLVRLALVVAGFAALAGGLTRTERAVEPARMGFGWGAMSSLVALHWIPAASEPWFGWFGALFAGLTVWSFHGAMGAVALELAGRARAYVGTGLALVPGWIVLEWLPGALPLVNLPRPPVAAALVELPGVSHLVSLVGAFGVSALLAGVAGAGSDVVVRDADRRSQVPGSARRGMGRRRILQSLPPVLLVALVLVAFARSEGDRVGPPQHWTVAEIPLDRAALTDPDRRAEAMRRGIDRGPADLWPESLLPDATGIPSGAAGGRPLAGVRTLDRVPAHNALARIGSDGSLEVVHRKHRLVPVVERTRLRNAGHPGRGLAPGPGPSAFESRGRRVGALICFEVLFPSSVAALRRDGATLLLHVANDAMLRSADGVPVLGRTPLLQQDRILALRAMESGMPIVRSSLGGRSGGWGPDGHALSRTEVAGTERQRWRIPVPGALDRPPAVRIGGWDGPAALLLLGLLAVARLGPSRDPGKSTAVRGSSDGTRGEVEG